LFVVIFRSFVVEPFKSYSIFAIHEKRNFANFWDISNPLAARFLELFVVVCSDFPIVCSWTVQKL